MDPATITGFVLAAIAIAGLLVAWHQDRMNHTVHQDEKFDRIIKRVVGESTDPLRDSLSHHSAQLVQQGERINRLEDMMKDNSTELKSLHDKLSQMSVKVDMYWASLEQLAMNAAKGLHQPHPERQRLDHLLEQFIEGTLTDTERTELKKILVQIRNYEPTSPPLEFPVLQGEQTFAAILLSTMDLVNPQHLASMGHSLHRSVRHKENKDGQGR